MLSPTIHSQSIRSDVANRGDLLQEPSSHVCVGPGSVGCAKPSQDTIAYLQRCRPRIAILENVATLVDGEVGHRDIDYITRDLASAGFFSFHEVLQAAEFGSPADRERVYIICLRGVKDPSGALASYGRDLLRGMKTGSMHVTEGFIISDKHSRDALDLMLCLGRSQSSPTQIFVAFCQREFRILNPAWSTDPLVDEVICTPYTPWADQVRGMLSLQILLCFGYRFWNIHVGPPGAKAGRGLGLGGGGP